MVFTVAAAAPIGAMRTANVSRTASTIGRRAPTSSAAAWRIVASQSTRFQRAGKSQRGWPRGGFGGEHVEVKMASLVRTARPDVMTRAWGFGKEIQETPAPEAGTVTVGRGEVDVEALATYAGATVFQAVLMICITCGLDAALAQSGLALEYQKAAVFAWFLFNALRSRVFSPLNASRPKVAGEKKAIDERKRPSWMPPPLAFPIIWSTIALLRAGSSVAVFTTTGTLNDPAIFAMVAHLAVGDTWNSINNVEKRLGTAVLGVGAVLLSVYNVVFQYYSVLPTAGFLIAPSAVWISVATFLVYSIWKLNPAPDGELEPLLPRKSQ